MTEDYKKKYPIGSKWKTRGGDIATVIYHNNDNPEMPIVAVMKNCGIPCQFNINGIYCRASKSNLDLIEPYTEPKRGVGYLNVYEDGHISSDLHQTRLGADKRADEGHLACIRVEWTEGQFDE